MEELEKISKLLYLKDVEKNDFVSREIVEKYNENLEKLKNLIGIDVTDLKLGKSDIFKITSSGIGGNYLYTGNYESTQIGYVTDTSSTTEFVEIETENYKKSNMLLKLYQLILLLKKYVKN